MTAKGFPATALWQRDDSGDTENIKYPVIFDSRGGTEVPGQSVNPGGKATNPKPPTRPGYSFDGWFTEDGTPYDFDTPVNAPLTLYAHWRKSPIAFVPAGDAMTWMGLALLAAAGFGVLLASRRREEKDSAAS